MLDKLLARQLGNPSGFVGRLVLARLWNRRNAALNNAALAALALRPHDRVLEVGCGGGYLLGRMAAVVTDGFLAGADVSPAMVAFCAKQYRALVAAGRLALACAPAEALPYPAGHFSRTCSVNSIFYWADAPQALAELWRVLAAGGVLVLCFTDRASLETKGFARHGVTTYEAGPVQQMMAATGFRGIALARAEDRHRTFWCATGSK